MIVAFGGLIAIGLSYWLESKWYLFTLLPFAVWAWLYSYEEINTASWHYRLTEEFFPNALKGLCKTCPYWGLVAASVVLYITGMFYAIVLQLIVYVWHTFWLLFGFKPDWSKSACERIHRGYPRLYKTRRKENVGTVMDISRVWPVCFIAPPAITLAVLHVGTEQIATLYRDWQWYVTVPLTYVAVLGIAGFIEAWKVTAWPAIRWSYGKACPDVKFVEKAHAPARPQLPPSTNPY